MILTELFYWVLNMSITVSWIGAILLLIRRIPGLPRRFVYPLWLIPLVRAWIPFGIPSEYSLMNLLARLGYRYAAPKLPALPDATVTNHVVIAQSYFPVTYPTVQITQILSAAAFLWMLIALAAVITVTVIYTMTESEMKHALPQDNGSYLSSTVLAPAVFGVFRPKIVLPPYVRKEYLPFVLLHEKTHIRRLDNLWRVCAIITCCVHWFNPMIWLLLRAFFADMELSCDEAVLRQCGEDAGKDYACALLSCETDRSVFVSSFSGAKTRLRIKKILSYRKLSAAAAIFLLIFLSALTIVLLTNGTI